MELKNEFAKNLTLRAILLRNSQISIAPDFDPLIPNQLLEGQFRIPQEAQIACRETRLEADGQVTKDCLFAFTFEFRYIRSEGAEKSNHPDAETSMASIKAEIVVDYLFNGPSFPSQEELDTWAKSAALVQAWPYWREYCHSTLIRTGLPMALVPMLLMNQKIELSEKEEGES